MKNLLSKKNLLKFTLIIIPFFTVFFSLYQLNLQYDGYHHGVVYSISQDFLNGQVPYKDFLPHYGIFYILVNSIFIKFFSNSIFGIYFIISMSKGLTFLFFGLLIKKLFNINIAVSTLILLFLVHPFVDTPWPDYLFFLLVLVSFYLFYISKSKTLYLISGFIYSLAALTKDNFFFILIFSIISFSLIFIFLRFYKRKNLEIDLISLFSIIGFFIPLISFFVYLEYHSITNLFFDHFEVGKFNILYHCNSNFEFILFRTVDCAIISFFLLIKKSFFNFFLQPYWFFFLIIIFTNIFFILNIFFFDESKNISKKKLIIISLSFLSLLLYSNNLYFLTVQRLFTGVSFGIITLIYIIDNLKSPISKFIIHCFLFVFLINSFQLGRTPNNPIYPTYYDKQFNDKNELDFLRYKKLSKNEWKQLNQVNDIINQISDSCLDIKFSTNLTNDVFYRIILKEKFELINFIPFGPRDKFITELFNKFDPNYFVNLNEKIKKKQIIILIDSFYENKYKFFDNEEIYLFKSIKYNNYGTRFINIYLPNDCKI